MFSASAVAEDKLLKVKITGVDGALKRNIQAYLGEDPVTEAQRDAYLFNVSDSVNQALESLGYYHGKLNQTLTRDAKEPWQLSLEVTAGEVTKLQWVNVRIEGEMLHDPIFERWLNSVALKPGDNLNHGDYEQMKSQLSAIAFARGYFDGHYQRAEIRINRDLNTAQINLVFDSGERYRFGDISFTGSTLEPELLDKLIPFRPHAKYNTRRIAALNQQLLDTGYFASIKVLPQLDKLADGKVPVKAELTPKPAHSFQVGLGADIGNGSQNELEPRVTLVWKTPQVNRYGHSQETSLEWSPDRPKALFTYTIPLSHPLNDQLQFKAGLLWDSYGVSQTFDPESGEYRNSGQLESRKKIIGVARNKRISGWLFSYYLNGLQERYNQSEIAYDPMFVMLGSSISKTVRSDNSLDPKSGYRQLYSVEYTDPLLGSDTRLTRIKAQLKWIDTFFEKHRLVSRLDLGVNLTGSGELAEIPPSLRYFAGGDQSIRGFSYQELGPYIEYTNSDGEQVRQVVGGRYLAVGSIEYQYYVTPTWRVAAFVDGGNAFDAGQLDPVVSVGGGVHWISPLGPIKLDIGFGVRDPQVDYSTWRIHLTMGTEL
ncbi:autotransporter assembly complex protein TamA [Shewanella avicenniae]|uniref:autotransporter assembly complex protein TamA n=1 Tax=Shewanella avicenniae TaxID=2814294 RepID=UPI001E3316A6|nr:autotransporter assembly complex family protein [Shewanella avicenniae]